MVGPGGGGGGGAGVGSGCYKKGCNYVNEGNILTLVSPIMPINESPRAREFTTSEFLLDTTFSDDCSNSMHNVSPCVQNISTPVFSENSDVANTNVNISEDTESNTSDNAIKILHEIRKKYIKNVIIGHLKINTLENKFEALKLIVTDKLDILVLVETKLDDSFPENQFIIEG